MFNCTTVKFIPDLAHPVQRGDPPGLILHPGADGGRGDQARVGEGGQVRGLLLPD